MRAGSRRGVLGSVGHGAGRDHVCSQVVTERYSLRMYARGSERTSEFRPVWHPRNPASGSRRRTAGGSASYARRHAARRPEREDDEDPDPPVRRRDLRCSAEDSLRVTCTTTEPVARRAFRSLSYITYYSGASGVGRSVALPSRLLIVRVRSDPCTCTVERSTPTTT